VNERPLTILPCAFILKVSALLFLSHTNTLPELFPTAKNLLFCDIAIEEAKVSSVFTSSLTSCCLLNYANWLASPDSESN